MNNKAYYCDIKTGEITYPKEDTSDGIKERARISFIISSYLCPFDDEHKISEEEYRQALEDMKKYS
jgi:hypothetical protein